MSNDPMHITEAELTAMTSELRERHEATLPVMKEGVAQWVSELREAGFGRSNRRRFLAGSGLALGGLVLAACGSDSKDDDMPGAGATGGSKKLEGDLIVVGLAAALEIGAVNAYQAGLDAAAAGKLGNVPPAVATFAQTAQQQHRDHAAAWNGVLTSAGFAEIKDTSNIPSVEKVVTDGLAGVKDVASLAKFALSLEDIAAATYLGGLGAITNEGGIKTAASIQPVERQHSAILRFVLGEYPVPDDFAKADGGVGPDAFVQA